MKLLDLHEDIELKGAQTKDKLDKDPKNLSDILNVTGNVNISKSDLKTIPWKFGKVTGYFDCKQNNLTSLKGCPNSVGSHFDCDKNNLTSLEGGPSIIEGAGPVINGYSCRNCNLTSLEGAPTSFVCQFDCYDNKLTSLKGCPPKVDFFNCKNNLITSLEDGPSHVSMTYNVTKNKIKSLVGIHKYLKHCRFLILNFNPIEEGGLGLLLIEGLETITTTSPAISIIAKYVGQGKKGMMLAQAELIENGYETYAKL